jgi:hypothetical protein
MSGSLVVIDWTRLSIRRRDDVFCFSQLYSASLDLHSIVCGVIMTTNSFKAVTPGPLVYDHRMTFLKADTNVQLCVTYKNKNNVPLFSGRLWL